MAMLKLDSQNNEVFNLNKRDKSISRERKSRQKRYDRDTTEFRNKPGQKEIHTKLWQDTRKQVIVADGGECQRCLALFGWHTIDNLEVHHIKSRIEFPELVYDIDNMVTVCHTCNLALGLKGLDFKWDPSMRFREVDEEIRL